MIDLIIKMFYDAQRYLPVTEIAVNHFTFGILKKEHALNTSVPIETILGIPLKIEKGNEQEIKIIIR